MADGTNLLLMVQALIVVLQRRRAFLRARHVFLVGVHDVAGEQFLPEGKAAGRACLLSVSCGENSVSLSLSEREGEALGWEAMGCVPPCRPYPDAILARGAGCGCWGSEL